MHQTLSPPASSATQSLRPSRHRFFGQRSHVSSIVVAFLAAFSLVIFIIGMVASPANAADREELDHGHMDIFNVVSTDDGGIAMNLKEDVTGQHVQRSPEGVLLRVKDAAHKKFPPAAAEHGLPSEGYLLPLTQDQNLLWPGWDTLGVVDKDKSKPQFKAIDINFKEVKGPGDVYIFTQNFGAFQSLLADGGYKLATNSTISQSSPAHTHTNWIFTKPGVYTMKVNATGDKEGKTYSTDTHTYTWLVGNDTKAPVENSSDNDGDASGGDSSGGNTSGGNTSGGDTSGGDTSGGAETGTVDNSGSSSLIKDAGSSAPLAANTNANTAQCTAKTVSDGNKLGLVPAIRDDRKSPAKMISPADVVFRLGSAAKATTKGQVGAIGSGTDVYMIGATQIQDVPWLGANTMNESIMENSSGEVLWRLTGFEGPGDMEVFTSGNFGEVVGEKWFSATGGQPAGQVTIPRNTHVHPNWVFTQAGTYKVTVEQSTTLNDGTVVSAPTTLTFLVGDETSAAGATDVATEGHFDLGAQIVAGAEHTVWTTPDGKPCEPGNSNGAGQNSGNHGSSSKGGSGNHSSSGKNGGSSSAAQKGGASQGGKLASTGLAGLLIPLLVFAVGLVALGLSFMRFVHK